MGARHFVSEAAHRAASCIMKNHYDYPLPLENSTKHEKTAQKPFVRPDP